MFFAVHKEDETHCYSSKDLKGLHEQIDEYVPSITDFDFYKGTKIEVREIPSRLELVSEVKKPASVRKPVAKSKK